MGRKKKKGKNGFLMEFYEPENSRNKLNNGKLSDNKQDEEQ